MYVVNKFYISKYNNIYEIYTLFAKIIFMGKK